MLAPSPAQGFTVLILELFSVEICLQKRLRNDRNHDNDRDNNNDATNIIVVGFVAYIIVRTVTKILV